MLSLKLTEIADATRGRVIGNDLKVSEVSTDSRKAVGGSLFVPIRGENFDGHDFIGSAIQSGASAFFSEREIADARVPYVLVNDTRRALGDLSAYYRSLFDIPIIAVTGSAGKTSVKNGIAAVIGQKYSVLKTEGNYNNDIGLPLTVFNLTHRHNAAVFEMGMNSFGEISYLSKIAKPDIGVITNVGTAHIERLGSREGILRAKLEITDGMNESGILILNYDNDLSRTIGGKVAQKILWVSAQGKADVYAKNVRPTSGAAVAFSICYGEREIDTEIPIGESALITNALMSAAAGFLLRLSDAEVKKGVEASVSEKARLETRETVSGGVIINDSYNANTDSMKLALDALSRYNIEKIAILGDMLEQGEYAEAFHSEIGEYAYKSGADTLIAIGNDAKYYKESFDALNTDERKSYYFETKEDFFDAGICLEGKKAVLLKASRGMRFEEIFGRLSGIGV